MQHVFGDHIGQTVEAYVDDIVVKTRKADVLMQNQHLAPSTQQAEEASLTHVMDPETCQSIYLKLTKE
jgi:hypothetical protein